MKIQKAMNYDSHILNPFQTIHGLIALWEQTFHTKIEPQIIREMEQKLIDSHKYDVLFQHNMIMVAFAIFYEKFKNDPNWEKYNLQIPYINENALKETQIILESINKSIEESKMRLVNNDKQVYQKFINLYKCLLHLHSTNCSFQVPQNRPVSQIQTDVLTKREVPPNEQGNQGPDNYPTKQLRR